MPLNVLYESPVGFALFSVLDEGKLKEVSDVNNIFNDPRNSIKFFYYFSYQK